MITDEQKKAIDDAATGAKPKSKAKRTRQAHAEAAAAVGNASALTSAELVDLNAIAQQFRQSGQVIGMTAIQSLHQGVSDVFTAYQQHGGIQFLIAPVGDRAASLPEASAPRMLSGATEPDKNEAIAAIEALFVDG